MGRFFTLVKKHPVWTAISTFLAIWTMASDVWGSFSNRPMVPSLMGAATGSYGFVVLVLAILRSAVVPAAFALLVLIAIEVRKRPLPPPPSEPYKPTEAERVQVRALRSAYRGHGWDAAGILFSLLMRIKSDLGARNKLAPLLEHPAVDLNDRRSVVNGMLGRDDVPLKELIEHAVRLLGTYANGIKWLHNSEQEGIPLMAEPYLDLYKMWGEEHLAFCADLKRLMDGGGFDDLSVGYDAAVKRNPDAERYRIAFDKATARLGSLAEEEEAFLDIFCMPELTFDPQDTKTWMTNAVFHAGGRLVRDGLIISTDIDRIVRRFCLPEATNRAWNSSGASTCKHPVRECADLRLDAVRGTSASGGGAGGIHDG